MEKVFIRAVLLLFKTLHLFAELGFPKEVLLNGVAAQFRRVFPITEEFETRIVRVKDFYFGASNLFVDGEFGIARSDKEAVRLQA